MSVPQIQIIVGGVLEGLGVAMVAAEAIRLGAKVRII